MVVRNQVTYKQIEEGVTHSSGDTAHAPDTLLYTTASVQWWGTMR